MPTRDPMEILRAQRALAAQERSAAGIDAIATGLKTLRSDLEQTRKELADLKADQDRQRNANAAQAIIDKKKQRRHEYLVAAFTVALTLLLEHFGDVIQLAKLAFKSIVALLK